MKYIIEFEDKPSCASDGFTYYKCKQAPWWSLSDVIVGRLTPAQDILDEIDKIKQRVEEAYQRGLDDAWEAARKIVTWPDRSLVNSNTFDLDHGENIFTKYSASEAIAKLKAYEEKQKEEDSIKVGDEVINNITGTKGILLEPETEDLLATVIVPNHRWNTFNISHINLTKTGRHFDIEGILEDMQE